MIDMHCHLLPGLDDGPDTIEESLKMASVAYEKGTRHIVCTPHLHHPLGFESDLDKHRQVFDELKAEISKIHPDLKLSLGAELYVSRRRNNELKDIPIRTLGESKYLLVEFDRNIKISEMEHVLNELQLMGYIPVVAHVEVYKSCIDNLDRLESWRREGILLQCNASSILHRNHQLVYKAVHSMLAVGLVSFIASDGHDPSKRKPVLKDAYVKVAIGYGRGTADRLFRETQELILANEKVEGLLVRPFKRTVVIMKAVMVTAVLLLMVSCIRMMQTEDEKAVVTHIDTITDILAEESTDKTAADTIVDTTDIVADESADTITDIVADESTNKTAAETIVDTTYTQEVKENDVVEIDNGSGQENHDVPVEEVVVSDVDPLVRDYIDYLAKLETDYIEKVDVYFERLKAASLIEDQADMESAVSDILDELGLVEAQSDNEVYKTLYDMQNDMEDENLDVSIVEEIRAHYLAEKEEVANRYRDALEQYFDN